MKNLKSWFKDLSQAGKVSVIIAATMGSLFVASAATQPSQKLDVEENTEPMTSVQKESILTTKTETETVTIPFEKQSVENSLLDKGATKIQTPGVNGIKTITYKISLKDGAEVSRTSTEAITTAPVTEVTAIGTYVKPAPAPSSSCDSNYSGCVPIASDVDCAGGSGDGPVYVSGPVRVVGSDVYGLDRDGNGLACE